eukprot:2623471-Amphidinium_carterae.1
MLARVHRQHESLCEVERHAARQSRQGGLVAVHDMRCTGFGIFFATYGNLDVLLSTNVVA